MKILEYFNAQPEYMGFQWNGEPLEEVRETIEIIQDYLEIYPEYRVFVDNHFDGNKRRLEVTRHAPELLRLNPGDFLLIGDEGQALKLSRSDEMQLFHIKESPNL